jgi:hypothetical protein
MTWLVFAQGDVYGARFGATQREVRISYRNLDWIAERGRFNDAQRCAGNDSHLHQSEATIVGSLDSDHARPSLMWNTIKCHDCLALLEPENHFQVQQMRTWQSSDHSENSGIQRLVGRFRENLRYRWRKSPSPQGFAQKCD